uniref:Uncharacterized protein n=1 Tax=Arundo donax TaxID=35708 RepID=A0A0A9GA69_ARUDO
MHVISKSVKTVMGEVSILSHDNCNEILFC